MRVTLAAAPASGAAAHALNWPNRMRGKLRAMSSAASKRQVEPSRLASWRAGMNERMVRSSRVFLLGLVVACGVEVLVDWNQTLMEINALRNSIRQKGESYVAILAKASDDELATSDKAGLDRLSHGIFDDEDALYVRFTDATGAVVWDKLKADLSDTFKQTERVEPFTRRYAHFMKRDTDGVLHDPARFTERVANSRYKDFAQAWTDATSKALALVMPPKPTTFTRGTVVYQDRLRDQNHRRDDKISYAIGTVVGENGRDIGTVIVAFDMERTNHAVRLKYLKFGGICSFFVALILVQNTVSRRNRLRLLDLKTRYSAANKALREAMPSDDIRCGQLLAVGAIEQASGPVDGMLWSASDEGNSLLVLVIDPAGDGVDAAAVGLHVLRTFLGRRQKGTEPTLDDEMRALGEAASGIPLTRPIGSLLLRVDSRTGLYRALFGSFAQLRVQRGATYEAPPLQPSVAEVPQGIVGPLFCASGALEPGKSVVAVCSSTPKKEAKALGDGLAKYLARTHEPGKAVPVQDAAIWARGKSVGLAENDIAIVAVTRERES